MAMMEQIDRVCSFIHSALVRLLKTNRYYYLFEIVLWSDPKDPSVRISGGAGRVEMANSYLSIFADFQT